MNLTIDEMRTIVDGAPDKTIIYCQSIGDYYKSGVASVPCEDCLFISNLRTAIATHDLKPCSHGYDIACLICGFGTENGVRVWRKQIDSDDVTDIRNHVSPNTVVIEL